MKRIARLVLLYLVQGLPLGIMAGYLPLMWADAGFSDSRITMLQGVLVAPWMLNIVVAPFVDTRAHPTLGLRRGWLLPLLVCAALAYLALGLGVADGARGAWLLALGVFFLNAFVATADIAVDGLAVSTLKPRELGLGNAAQVGGFKIGTVLSGGIAVSLSEDIAYTTSLLAMGGLTLVAGLAVLTMREPEPTGDAASPSGAKDLWRTLFRVLAHRGTWALLVFLFTYKSGESIADSLFRLWLKREGGFSNEDIGYWVGTWGMAVSFAGTLAGGALASVIPLHRALVLTAFLRVIPLGAEWWLVVTHPGHDAAIAVTLAEHFFGGALTPVIFALMMANADPRFGGTHFAALGIVEKTGKGLFGFFAGMIRDATSYAFAFGLAFGLSVAFLGLLPWVGRVRDASQATRAA